MTKFRTAPRTRLTECLSALVKRLDDDLGTESVHRFGPGGEFQVRVATSAEDRRRAWALAYRVYLEKEYAAPNPQGLWYSLHDALPETVTVLVERTAVEGGGAKVDGGRLKVEGRGSQAASTLHLPPSTVVPDPSPSTLKPQPSTSVIGAVTIVPDSRIGLPADATFPQETARMRAEGRRLAEAVSLVQAGVSERTGMPVVAKLCELTCLVARRVLGATDLVITVNPRHEDYYRRVMLFERRGGEAGCDKVRGAPAVFLTLSLADMARYIADAREPGAPRTIYRRFMPEEESAELAGRIGAGRRPLDEAALRRYFAVERALLSDAPQAARMHLADCYLAYDLDRLAPAISSRDSAELQ